MGAVKVMNQVLSVDIALRSNGLNDGFIRVAFHVVVSVLEDLESLRRFGQLVSDSDDSGVIGGLQHAEKVDGDLLSGRSGSGDSLVVRDGEFRSRDDSEVVVFLGEHKGREVVVIVEVSTLY